ncbi:MAG: bifunctional glutamate N-acetyltransferase/amino-acid acetyltransferase ArgJ [Holosporales bacterium]|jgi:glutamate N-acetyltransferase/amino-acid N-acetyltransferase
MPALKPSPLAPASPPALPPIRGVRLAVFESGIRYKGRPDVLVAVLEPGASVAGALTRSKTRSASVDWCRVALESGRPARGLVVNAGNANAFTGRAGIRSVEAIVDKMTALLKAKKVTQIYQSSTGVIGVPLDHGKITGRLKEAVAAATPDNWLNAALAIGTTDTFPKLATVRVGGYTLNGIAKGSGMIAPDMATMLAYVFTDAPVAQADLQAMTRRVADASFNAITVDSDTSTSDTLLVFATGQDAPLAGSALTAFEEGLLALCRDLAIQIVKDGEGAEKLITITVTGAESAAAARKIGLAIANSPLVKTAIAGEDANWGRVVAAVGKSGEAADRDKLSVSFGGTLVAKDGEVVPDYDETPVAAHLKTRDVRITVDVGVGTGEATVYTCDLTQRYLEINAGYRS